MGTLEIGPALFTIACRADDASDHGAGAQS